MKQDDDEPPLLSFTRPTFERLEAHPLTSIFDLKQDEMNSINDDIKKLDKAWDAVCDADQACRLARTRIHLMEKRRAFLDYAINTGKQASQDEYDNADTTFETELSEQSPQSNSESWGVKQDAARPPLRSSHEARSPQSELPPSDAKNRSQTH